MCLSRRRKIQQGTCVKRVWRDGKEDCAYMSARLLLGDVALSCTASKAHHFQWNSRRPHPLHYQLLVLVPLMLAAFVPFLCALARVLVSELSSSSSSACWSSCYNVGSWTGEEYAGRKVALRGSGKTVLQQWINNQLYDSKGGKQNGMSCTTHEYHRDAKWMRNMTDGRVGCRAIVDYFLLARPFGWPIKNLNTTRTGPRRNTHIARDLSWKRTEDKCC